MLVNKRKRGSDCRAVTLADLNNNILSKNDSNVVRFDLSLDNETFIVPSGHNMVGNITISGSNQPASLVPGDPFQSETFIQQGPDRQFFGHMDSGLVSIGLDKSVDHIANIEKENQDVVDDFYSFIKKKAPGPMIKFDDFDH